MYGGFISVASPTSFNSGVQNSIVVHSERKHWDCLVLCCSIPAGRRCEIGREQLHQRKIGDILRRDLD